MKKIIIAIDGHSSCGKSTVAKDIARQLGIAYVDTGAMYRCVTLYAMRQGYIHNGEVDEVKLQAELDNILISFRNNPLTGRNETYLNGEMVENEIRGMEVSNNVSTVSAISSVRAKLVDYQRDMAKDTSLVMDGRDIGTVVFPNADLKLFMTADVDVRAKRRYDELSAKNQAVNLDEIAKNVRERDVLDSTRKESPLRQAPDALLLDNSHMTMDEQFQWIMNRLKERELI